MRNIDWPILDHALCNARGAPNLAARVGALAELEVQGAQISNELENPTLQAAEREHILRVLREAAGQIGGPEGAAERLGLKRTTLNSKMKKLGIERSDYMKSS
jgi:transcriptional regulator with GAF, ATPase, and Fis domain